MKRFWLYLIGLILLIAAAAAVVLAMNDAKDDKSKSAPSSDLTAPSESKRACSIFTLADAKQVLGDGAKGGVVVPQTSSDDLTVSACVYTQSSGPGAPVSSTKTASLVVQAPKTPAGSQSNANQFGDLKPTGVQDVAGYGDSAYWYPQYGQLNILKSGNWYIVSNGPVASSSRTLDKAKELADLLIDKM